MIALLECALIATGLLLTVPATVLFTQVLFSLPKNSPGFKPRPRPRLAVLVPAHDEESGIAATLSSVMPQLRSEDRLLVVADNCGDRTAAIARRMGAQVTERHDESRRGKGYALDHGVRTLKELAPPEVVVVIDADCQIEHGCIDALAALCAETHRPVQATYLMAPPRGNPSKLTSLAVLAWRMRNFVRPLGWGRLGFPCQLAGSGMAVPFDHLQTVELASGHIVEDLKLGIDLSLRGYPPIFCPEAGVSGRFPASREATKAQRTRWEHGSLTTTICATPALFVAIFQQRSFLLLGTLLDLWVPPLALLILMISGAMGTALVFYFATGLLMPTVLTSVTAMTATSAILLTWIHHGRDILPFWYLALAPLYAAAKIPLYAKLLFAREKQWVRTKRGDDC
jgi:cellulose synthase/poly-beta-1,6-N-acetylglucosamine synthase-like glycosyltransferase